MIFDFFDFFYIHKSDFIFYEYFSHLIIISLDFILIFFYECLTALVAVGLVYKGQGWFLISRKIALFS